MRPILFECIEEIPIPATEICVEIATLSRWPEFKGYGFLPGIAAAEYEVQTSNMIATRIRVRNTDGSGHIEEICEWEPGKKIVIWDQSRTHHSKPVKAYLAANHHILVETLPAYAPELNPEEYCHGHAKQRAKNHIATSVADMRKHIDRDFAFLRRHPHLLLSFFHHAGLRLKQLW
jgi:transposase